MNGIPELIPVNDDTQANTLKDIAIGDILSGDMILAGQPSSTGTTHRIIIIDKLSNDRFMGDHSGLIFKMESKGGNHEYFSLSIVHRGTQVEMYYGALHVKSIQKPIVNVIRDFGSKSSDIMDVVEPDISVQSELIGVSDIIGTYALIDTIRHNVKGVIGVGEEHNSKKEFSLAYLGDIRPGMTLSGKIFRPQHTKSSQFENIKYEVRRIGATYIALTRYVHHPRTRETKVKEYTLTEMRLITNTDVIGTIASSDGKEKGEFRFSIDSFQTNKNPKKDIAGSVARAVKKFVRV